MPLPKIVVAGGTGALGSRIVKELVSRGAEVVALVRPGVTVEKLHLLQSAGAAVVSVDLNDTAALVEPLRGAACVVSALSGLREVVIDVQKSLLDAAVQAGVPRFIPSDFSIDFTKLPPGSNRNLDLRRDFARYLDAAPVRATSIFNGPFMDLLTGEAPLVLPKLGRILYWGDRDQAVDYTTMDNTAAYTAMVAMDSSTPRALTIAGDTVSARQLAALMTRISGKPYKTLRAGSLGRLEGVIKIVRTLTPKSDALYPVWQGMQYIHNMSSGLAKTNQHLDNDRYPGITWTKAETVLAQTVSARP